MALIFAEGDITVDGKGIASESLCKNIRDARLDDNIKTIVLRVNSPGGSALASEEIWREVKLAADKKKVYVSMGNLAASGGYYISSAGT
ncbi:MAG TPA: ATP-dependent Clp protease proteolytic subunit, partial [Crocinitomicaceae bacterium]|nr:ATP-dependent Clp protease proteolytic subunit [Crocinitomicaceae bacterium]